MRAFLLLLLLLILGFAGGLYADRVEPSKSWIERHLAPWIKHIAPSRSAAALDPVEATPLALPDGDGQHSAGALAGVGASPCFKRAASEPEVAPPWLQRGRPEPTVFDRGRLAEAPDLADHPGLIKIEIIRQPDGSEREHCAAVRVAEHWFLSAAHCVRDITIQPPKPLIDMIAITPENDVQSETAQAVPISGAVCHSAYAMPRRAFLNDVSLLFVSDVSAFADVPVAVLETDAHDLLPRDMRRTYIAAWGKNGGTRYLQGSRVSIVHAGESILVAERIGARGPNVGDSGAPLYLMYENGPLVIGVLSQVTQDFEQNGARSLYVRLRTINDWITRTIAICEQNGRFVC